MPIAKHEDPFNIPGVERYVSPHPKPSPHAAEMLINLGEECNEVAQRVAKLMRFGAAEKMPGSDFDNRERLSHEVGHMLYMIDRVFAVGLLDPGAVEFGREEKREKLARYVQNLPVSQ